MSVYPCMSCQPTYNPTLALRVRCTGAAPAHVHVLVKYVQCHVHEGRLKYKVDRGLKVKST